MDAEIYEQVGKSLSKPFCVLAGAGISYPEPAGLPSAKQIMSLLISTLPLSEDIERSTLMSSFSPDWQEGLDCFDYLRFEQVVEALQQSTSRAIEVLRALFADAAPNLYHYQLAQLAGKGNIVLTTNFDTLLEKACAQLHIGYSVLVKESDYEDYLHKPGNYRNPIFKLHGTLSIGNKSEFTEGPLAIMESVLTESIVSPSKWEVVRQILAARDLMVVGYSGSDDFDVMPAIRFAPGERRLLWVLHDNTSSPVSSGLSERNTFPSGFDMPSHLRWFLGRMFGSFQFVGCVKRRREDIVVLKATTEEFMKYLVSGVELPKNLASSRQDDSWVKGSQLIRGMLGKENPESMLFTGLIFSSIGLFDRARVYMERAIALSEQEANHRVAAKANSALANIWLERGRRDLALNHMVQAKALFEHLNSIDKKDLLDLLEFSYWLRLDTVPTNLPLIINTEMGKLTRRQQDLVKRKLQIFKARRFLELGSHNEAMKKVLEIIKNQPPSLELEEEADLRFLVLQIDRDRNRFMVSAGLRDDPSWDNEEAELNDLLLQSIVDKYELLQRRKKLADAMIFHAEEYMWGGWPHWSEEFLSKAKLIYAKIGNQNGCNKCEQLQSHIEGIRQGKMGSTAYGRESNRSLSMTKKSSGGQGEIEFFCPRCNRLTRFRVRTCIECAWYVSDAPQSPEDQAMTSEECLRLTHSILIDAIGRAKKGLLAGDTSHLPLTDRNG